MQRFKKHFCDEYGRYSGGHPHMDKHGKFVYGANGTFTQAALWRADAAVAISLIVAERSWYHATAACSALEMAKRNGFRLP